MLIFVTTAAHGYTIQDLLKQGSTPLTGRVITMSYGEFLSWRKLPAGHYIFADVDRLKPGERDAVAERMEALQHCLPDARLLNHPQRSFGRYALLDRLHREGINDYRAIRATDDPADLRYPVFVRTEVEHFGSLTALLDSPAALKAALAELNEKGVPLADCLIVEFIDVRNPEGWYEKYSMLRVGEGLFATDRSSSNRWICKGDESEENHDNLAAEDLAFQRDAPHAEAVQRIFQLASIDYGRIDYAFSGGKLQVFEINTNPAIRVPEKVSAEWRPSADLHQQNLVSAMMPLLGTVDRRYKVPVPGGDGLERIDAPTRFRRLLRRLLKRLDALHHEHRILHWRDRLARTAKPGATP